MRKRRLGLSALAVGAAAILGTGSYLAVQRAAGSAVHGATGAHGTPSTPVPAKSTPVQPRPQPIGQMGDYRVAERWYTFTEHSNAYPGPRVLHVGVRFPVLTAGRNPDTLTSALFPLVIFAPGYRQCGASYRDLLRQWASAGYVVAAVDFPLTNCHVVAPDESDLVHQPADVAFVIRRLLRLARQPQGPLAGLIDPARIAVAGHSDGGDTVAAVAAASCCHDARVRAAIVLAGAEWAPLPGRWFAAPTPPMLFVQGTDDSWNPPSASVQLYQADTTGIRYYLDLFGADHFTPYEGDGTPEPIVARVTLDFLDRYVAGQPRMARAMWRAGRVPGVAELAEAGQMP